uniref:Uncharacterized protein n=1 Tax=Oryza sativa subsp. japonica TaxID=39947 RepID=Q69K93_ORYSJ|nr:hypothetical protein [Oryza sativa Japonica Group]
MEGDRGRRQGQFGLHFLFNASKGAIRIASRTETGGDNPCRCKHPSLLTSSRHSQSLLLERQAVS